jgi:hypothetical protein
MVGVKVSPGSNNSVLDNRTPIASYTTHKHTFAKFIYCTVPPLWLVFKTFLML